jgi:hypothetical protein
MGRIVCSTPHQYIATLATSSTYAPIGVVNAKHQYKVGLKPFGVQQDLKIL